MNCVFLKEVKSSQLILSGMSYLCSLHFNTFDNDIQDAIQRSTLCYYRKVKCVYGYTLLLLDIDSNRFTICRYEHNLNSLKSQITTLTCKTLAVLSHYCLDKSLIKQFSVVRDLGVILDNSILIVMSLQSLLLDILTRASSFCVSRSFVFMFRTLIQPKLDFTTVV